MQGCIAARTIGRDTDARWASAGALCAALFNHLYIWVHYYATERPDMARIYGRS